jgi:hypothetical protein
MYIFACAASVALFICKTGYHQEENWVAVWRRTAEKIVVVLPRGV